MRFSMYLATILLAGAASAEEDVDVELSGRFATEVVRTDGRAFSVAVTPVAAENPMTPVNQPGLHVSCFIALDILEPSDAETREAALMGGDRYCRAQFGDDHRATLMDDVPLISDRVWRFQGQCEQYPL